MCESFVEVDDVFPTDCVLCGHASDTHEEHERHMAEEHSL